MTKLIIDTENLGGSDLLQARYLAALSKYRTRARLFAEELARTGKADKVLVDEAARELAAIENSPEFRELQMLHISTAARLHDVSQSTLRSICNGHGANAYQIECKRYGTSRAWYVYEPDLIRLLDTGELIPRKKKSRAT